MPNWCENNLNIMGPADTLKLIVSNHVKGSALDFETVDPTPQELLAVDSSLEVGLPGWYQWRLDHWGCKWNQDGSGDLSFVDDNQLLLSFDTPWGPPLGIVSSLGKKYPDCRFEIRYVEHGNAFCGEFCVFHQDGSLIEEDVEGDYDLEFSVNEEEPAS